MDLKELHTTRKIPISIWLGATVFIVGFNFVNIWLDIHDGCGSWPSYAHYYSCHVKKFRGWESKNIHVTYTGNPPLVNKKQCLTCGYIE